jgi:phage-related protein
MSASRTSERAVSWLSPALRDFEDLPGPVRETVANALSIAAEGGKAAISKPLRGLGAGVLEVRCRFRGDTYRAVYALQVGDDIWVIHVFQKKAHQGRATPLHHVELIAARLSRLKEMLRHGWK